MLCLLGSDKPIIESLQPNSIDQTDALEKQFKGMSDVEFSYADYEEARTNLITQVNAALTEADKDFIYLLKMAYQIGVSVLLEI